MEFYERLQGLRREKGMTQEELAERLDVSRQAVSKWESGQTMPEIEKLVQMAQVFDVSLDYLVRGICEGQEKGSEGAEPCGEALGPDVVKVKMISKNFIFGIVAFVLGFVGILTICVLYILDDYSSFIYFLMDKDMWILLIICSFFSFLGLLLVREKRLRKID